MPDSACPFCRPDPARIVFVDDLVYVLRDGFPLNPGHALVIPKRHVANWFDLDDDEQCAVSRALKSVRAEILSSGHPADGFNIGINVGAAAGQTVMHVHVHLIPRVAGDVPDPRGGVRWVVPQRANYLRPADSGVRDGAAVARWPVPEPAPYWGPGAGAATWGSVALPLTDSLADIAAGALTTGPGNALKARVLELFRRSCQADLAVSFVMSSGVEELHDHLGEFLGRGGQLRLLTGTYLDVTEPDALAALVDLSLSATGSIELRSLATDGQSYHPKAYIFRAPDGSGAAFVGSSNLSRSALVDGIEWNYRLVTSADPVGFAATSEAFERVWADPRAERIDTDWIRRYRGRRVVPSRPGAPPPEPVTVPEAHVIQREALAALDATRAAGNAAGLVVLATGLGKTWLAAFDVQRVGASRVLFVAHRAEILAQSLRTFRRIMPDATMGFYNGETHAEADVLFASVQTLSRVQHLERFPSEAFDYVVVDEFHHADAPTYRRLIRHFRPRFLLGLTATPERTDGGNLLALCGENLVYQCDMPRGIVEGLLCPFTYHGVPDDIQYGNIPWRNGRFDETALENEWATAARARNAFEQWSKRGGARTLAFCVSVRHANFMADYFRRKGVAAAAVHAGHDSAPRVLSRERLESGELRVLFAVDIFNEGVDLPSVDTVMMLRPTESRIVFLQQLGRGLRIAPDKGALTVIDYIGNHRSFLMKPEALLGLHPGRAAVAEAIRKIEDGTFELPPGCSVSYELEVIQFLQALTEATGAEFCKEWYRDFEQREERRPTAVEAFHEGISLPVIRQHFGSWMRFVARMGGLRQAEEALLGDGLAGAFLNEMETTAMTRSFKMVVVLAMLDEGEIPGQIRVDTVVTRFREQAQRVASIRNETMVPLDDGVALKAYVVRNPLHFWSEGDFFDLEGDLFRTTFTVADEVRGEYEGLVRELAEWRLAAYLARAADARPGSSFEAKVIRNSTGQPILILPDRDQHPEVPSGPTALVVDSEQYQANFVKIALNKVTRPGQAQNELPAILWGWFGPNAGHPGTNFRVSIQRPDGTWVMKPVRGRRVIEQ